MIRVNYMFDGMLFSAKMDNDNGNYHWIQISGPTVFHLQRYAREKGYNVRKYMQDHNIAAQIATQRALEQYESVWED